MTTYIETADAYLSYLAHERRAAPLTVRAYRRALVELGVFMARRGRKSISDVDIAAVRGYLAELYDRGLAAASVEPRLAALRSFCDFARRRGDLPSNPARDVRGPRVVRHVPAVPTVSEAARICDSHPGDDTPHSGGCGKKLTSLTVNPL